MEHVGWVGVGLMGNRMVPHLLHAGHRVTIHARRPEAAAALMELGATIVDTPAEVARVADVTCTIVAMPADVESVYFGEAGLLSAARPGTVFVDMTTSSPELARRIAAAGERAGVGILDAPVSGGPAGAQSASLSIMVGGRADVLARVNPILSRLGTTIVHHGQAGAGQSAKIANQIAVGITMLGISEAFLFARASGLRPDAVLETLSAGIVGSSLLNYMWPRIAAGDLEPGFRVEHLIKDLGLALEAGHEQTIALPGTSLVKELYHAVLAGGHAGKGTQSLITALDPRWAGDRGPHPEPPEEPQGRQKTYGGDRDG